MKLKERTKNTLSFIVMISFMIVLLVGIFKYYN